MRDPPGQNVPTQPVSCRPRRSDRPAKVWLCIASKCPEGRTANRLRSFLGTRLLRNPYQPSASSGIGGGAYLSSIVTLSSALD